MHHLSIVSILILESASIIYSFESRRANISNVLANAQSEDRGYPRQQEQMQTDSVANSKKIQQCITSHTEVSLVSCFCDFRDRSYDKNQTLLSLPSTNRRFRREFST